MRAPRTKFHDRAPRSGSGDARRLGGDQSLEVKNAEETGLDELRFGDGSGHTEQRLTRKENRSFRHGPNVARKLKSREIIKEIGMNAFEERQSSEVGDVFSRKAHVFEEVEGLLQSGGNQIIAALGEVANKKFKRGTGFEAVLDVPRRHREFVEVGEQPRKWSAYKHLP